MSKLPGQKGVPACLLLRAGSSSGCKVPGSLVLGKLLFWGCWRLRGACPTSTGLRRCSEQEAGEKKTRTKQNKKNTNNNKKEMPGVLYLP